jgi:hypothetical protein
MSHLRQVPLSGGAMTGAILSLGAAGLLISGVFILSVRTGTRRIATLEP